MMIDSLTGVLLLTLWPSVLLLWSSCPPSCGGLVKGFVRVRHDIKRGEHINTSTHRHSPPLILSMRYPSQWNNRNIWSFVYMCYGVSLHSRMRSSLSGFFSRAWSLSTIPSLSSLNPPRHLIEKPIKMPSISLSLMELLSSRSCVSFDSLSSRFGCFVLFRLIPANLWCMDLSWYFLMMIEAIFICSDHAGQSNCRIAIGSSDVI